MKEGEIKKTQTDLGKNLTMIVPLIEELTEDGLAPLCLIGFEVRDGNTVRAKFITVSDDFDKTVLELCRQLVKPKESPSPSSAQEDIETRLIKAMQHGNNLELEVERLKAERTFSLKEALDIWNNGFTSCQQKDGTKTGYFKDKFGIEI